MNLPGRPGACDQAMTPGGLSWRPSAAFSASSAPANVIGMLFRHPAKIERRLHLSRVGERCSATHVRSFLTCRFVHDLPSYMSALDRRLRVVLLREIGQHLGARDRILGDHDARRALEPLADTRPLSLTARSASVFLITTYSTPTLREAAAELGHALHVQSREVGVVDAIVAPELLARDCRPAPACRPSSLAWFSWLRRLLPVRRGVDGDAGSHGAGDRDVADVHALGRGRLGANDRVHQGGEVRVECVGLERDLADRRRARCRPCRRGTRSCRPSTSRTALRDVERDRAGLRIRHETARTEDATELAELAHLVGRRDQHVEIEPAFLDLGEVLGADEIGAGVLASCAFAPAAMTSTRIVLPVPAGNTTVPRTT